MIAINLTFGPPRCGQLNVLLHVEQSNFRLTEPDFRRLDPYYRYSGEGNIDSRKVGYVMELSLSAILTSSGKGFSLHLFHRLAPMHLTEASLASSSAAICLLSIPQTTRFITSRSRTLNLFWRCRSSAMSRCFSRTMRSRVSDR
jgi:hypothetical protein